MDIIINSQIYVFLTLSYSFSILCFILEFLILENEEVTIRLIPIENIIPDTEYSVPNLLPQSSHGMSVGNKIAKTRLITIPKNTFFTLQSLVKILSFRIQGRAHSI